MARWTFGVGVPGVLLASALGLTVGPAAAASAALGAVVALVVIAIGLFAIAAVLQGEPALAMAGAAVVYIGQLILIAALWLVLREQEWLVGRAFSLAAILQVIALQVAMITGYVRGRAALDVSLPGGAQ